jgi:hypothetical protein
MTTTPPPSSNDTAAPAPLPWHQQPATQAAQAFMADPVATLTQFLTDWKETQLTHYAEQMQLMAALEVARRSLPDFKQFEPMILQELSQLIASDDDGVLDPWPTLLQRATDQFSKKLDDVLKQHTNLAGNPTTATPPTLETTHASKPQRVTPTYTRQAINAMSLDEFLSNEEAINNALRHNRIL